jgi:hypothetical protein
MRALFRVSLLFMPGLVFAGTVQDAGPTFGWDDINFAELNPFVDNAPNFALDSSWLDLAVGHGLNSDGQLIDELAFTDQSKWTFRFAEDSTVIFKDNFGSVLYAPWVVTDPGVMTPSGQSTNSDSGDVGGADFSFVYTPRSGDVGFGDLGKVHFLQIIRTITIYENDLGGPLNAVTQYFIDNLGSNTTPFADEVGANSQLPNGSIVTNPDKTTGKFFFDDPDRCEPFPYGYGVNPNCMTDVDPSLVFIDWEAQTFVSLDNLNGTRNDVVLYGGPWWGFTYTNSDAPEPATVIPTVLALFGLVGLRARRRPFIYPPSASIRSCLPLTGGARAEPRGTQSPFQLHRIRLTFGGEASHAQADRLPRDRTLLVNQPAITTIRAIEVGSGVDTSVKFAPSPEVVPGFSITSITRLL